MEEKTRSTVLRFVIDFASSTIAGIISRSLTAPLDRVKLILQTRTPSVERKGGVIWGILRQIYTEQGFFSLWRGNFLTILKVIPSQSLIFGFHTYYFRLLISEEDLSKSAASKTLFYSSTAGILAAGTTITLTYPIYFCQTIISSHYGSLHSARFSSVRGCFKQTFHSVGLKGIFRGFAYTATSVTVNRAVYFGLYDYLKANDWDKILSAQVASTSACVVGYPLETVGRRMIVDVFEKNNKKGLSLVVDIYGKGGLLNFYRGGLTNILRSFSGAIILVLHDYLSEFLVSEVGKYSDTKNL